MIRILFALTILYFAQAAYSQGTLAPLYVFTNGNGNITPYQSGQMLEVGQSYDLLATPAAGYQFSSWEQLSVFVFTQTNYSQFGDPILPPVISIVPLVVLTNFYEANLEFEMQDTVLVTASSPNIVEAIGWQADFVPIPVPEPAPVIIIGCGLVVTVVMRHRQRRRCRILVRD
ncbi:MAG TPA: hypothetical protein VGJ73_00735 [Verrucomicrobiae bacterium]|jgi:hypothetical protein